MVGVLSKGANINLGGHEVSLDRYLVMPSFDIEEDPINAEDASSYVQTFGMGERINKRGASPSLFYFYRVLNYPLLQHKQQMQVNRPK